MTMVEKITLQATKVQEINSPPSLQRAQDAPSGSPGFEDVLSTQLGRAPTIRFSSHAQRRIASRKIDFGSDEAVRLEQAVEKAASKGSRESLILMDDLALVVSIKNRVVITAVDGNSRKENVFTNIDSVVLS
jgi:flagellar operon protein